MQAILDESVGIAREDDSAGEKKPMAEAKGSVVLAEAARTLLADA